MKDEFPYTDDEDDMGAFYVAMRNQETYGSWRLGYLIADGANLDDLLELAHLGNKFISGQEQLGQWLESLTQDEMNFIRKLFGLRPRNS